MRYSLLKLENLLKDIFEGNLDNSITTDWIDRFIPMIHKAIDQNIIEIDGKIISPNIFHVRFNKPWNDNLRQRDDFNSEVKELISQIIEDKKMSRRGPLIIKVIPDEEIETSFSIDAYHTNINLGNTIRIRDEIAQSDNSTEACFGLLISPSGDKFEITKARTTIGRSEENDLVIDNLLMSRQHAVIQIKDAGHVIKDLESNKGTYVNGNRIEEQTLISGDVLTLGDISMIYMVENNNKSTQNPITKKIN